MDSADQLNRCKTLAVTFGLTPREQEVLVLLAGHESGAAIQSMLGISKNTYKTHVRHVYAKLYVSCRDELRRLVEGI